MAIFTAGVVLWMAALVGSYESEVQELGARIVELEAELENGEETENSQDN